MALQSDKEGWTPPAWVRWWREVGRTRQMFAGVAMAGVMALVVLAVVADSPWPFVLAAVLTLPYGLIAYVGIYPAWAVARIVVTALTGAEGDTNDRWTQVVTTPINMISFAAAMLATLRMLDTRLNRIESTQDSWSP